MIQCNKEAGNPFNFTAIVLVKKEGTGIKNNNRETINNNHYYDLQGHKVAQPSKGLYIINGKKVLVR
jgi:hypothetical protein